MADFTVWTEESSRGQAPRPWMTNIGHHVAQIWGQAPQGITLESLEGAVQNRLSALGEVRDPHSAEGSALAAMRTNVLTSKQAIESAMALNGNID